MMFNKNQASFASSTNPQISHSFTEENRHLKKEDKRLDIEILRMLTIDKQSSVQPVWHYHQAQLCDFFTNYQVFPEQKLVLEELLQSNILKLIKREGKIYFGEIHKNSREGKGISLSREGKIYEGTFVGNAKNGEGIEIYPNGNLFLGEFMNNKKHGNGTFYWFNLSSHNPSEDEFVEYYEGEWWGGLPDGMGLHQKINGDYYEGLFKNGLKHGQGEQSYGNGDYYKGQYVNGMPEGFGEYFWADGNSFRGDFKQGARNGYGLWKAGQHLTECYKGQYINDKKCGHGVYVWENGWYYKGHFQNDSRHGYGELYNNKNDVQYRGFWENGEQVDKQVVVKTRTISNAFRSVQFTRYDPRILPPEETQLLDKRPRPFSTKVGFKKSSKKEYSTISQANSNIRRHFSSTKSSKNNILNKSTKYSEHSSKAKLSTKRAAGSIKSNLFVPFTVPKKFK